MRLVSPLVMVLSQLQRVGAPRPCPCQGGGPGSASAWQGQGKSPLARTRSVHEWCSHHQQQVELVCLLDWHLHTDHQACVQVQETVARFITHVLVFSLFSHVCVICHEFFYAKRETSASRVKEMVRSTSHRKSTQHTYSTPITFILTYC